MILPDLIVFVLTVWGVVYVTTASALGALVRVPIMLMNPPPLVRALLYCPKCQAFWIGLVLSVLFTAEPWLVLETWPYRCAPLYAVVAMGATAACAPLSQWATDAYQNELEVVLDVKEPDDRS